MITIHYRTPRSLELSISAGNHVRHFAANSIWTWDVKAIDPGPDGMIEFTPGRRVVKWQLEEFGGDVVMKYAPVSLWMMFQDFRQIEKNLLTFQKSGVTG